MVASPKGEVWSGMPEATWQALAAYLDDLRPLLRLADWSVDFQREPASDDDAVAMAWKYDEKRGGKVWVCADFADRDADDQRQALVHELLHFHLAQLDSVVDAAEAVMGTESATLFRKLWTVSFEQAVDAIADALAPHMPLPGAASGPSD